MSNKTIAVDEYHRQAAALMPESELQENVRQLCKTLGYLYFHVWNSKNSPSGYPDCSIVTRDDRLVFAELKREAKAPTLRQQEWLSALAGAGAEVYIWRPSDWLDGTIERILTGEQAT